jgi:hypothetical protein
MRFEHKTWIGARIEPLEPLLQLAVDCFNPVPIETQIEFIRSAMAWRRQLKREVLILPDR